MDANGCGENDDARAPLLPGPGRRRNSVASMRGEFVSRLPKKVLDAVDPERPSHVDFSRSKGLLEGSTRDPKPLAAFLGCFPLPLVGSLCPYNLYRRFVFLIW
jgi:hypothetical protein